jgi:hypothetical protein
MEKLIIPSILTVSDVVSMTDAVLKITLPATEFDVKFRDLYSRNKLIFDRLVKNQKNTLKSGLTDLLFLRNKNRGSAYLCFRYIINGLSLSIIEDVSAKASKLLAILEKHGKDVYRRSYKAESAVLLSLFQEFDSIENQQILADLGLIQYYNSLKAAQGEFDLVSSQKSEEKTLLNKETEAATFVLDEMIPSLTGLVAMLQLYSEIEPAVYSDMFNRVVTSISETNTTARSRQTRKQNKKEEEKPAKA